MHYSAALLSVALAAFPYGRHLSHPAPKNCGFVVSFSMLCDGILVSGFSRRAYFLACGMLGTCMARLWTSRRTISGTTLLWCHWPAFLSQSPGTVVHRYQSSLSPISL